MSDFVERYGGIYEHSPWVAERIEARFGADLSGQRLAHLMADCVDNASREMRLALIRAHPDLAGHAQVAGELTAESTEEQASAGLDQCTPEEYAQFQQLNDDYKAKFDFPFVMAVRNSSRQDILAAFVERLDNDYDAEFETAIEQIHQIAAMRLQAMEQAA